MRDEISTATKWYWWLWLSPLLTVPTIIGIVLPRLFSSDSDHILLIAVLGSGIWHLVLLIPAFDPRNEFVRWHGRQALILAGIRTAIPAGYITYASDASSTLSELGWMFLTLIVVWFAGTLWGQIQASHGDCALMQWTGHDIAVYRSTKPAPPPDNPDRYLPIDTHSIYHVIYQQGRDRQAQGQLDTAAQAFCRLLVSAAPPDLKAQAAAELKHQGTSPEGLTGEVLVAVFRFSQDQEQRNQMLVQLEQLGMVEPF